MENSIVELVTLLIESKQGRDYIKSFHQLQNDSEVLQLKQRFSQAKTEFEIIEPYGKYAPDFKEKRRLVRRLKRELDTNNVVSLFKYHETSFQNMLDYMTFDLATVVSNEIKIDAGNPFFEFAKKSCGGNCHVG